MPENNATQNHSVIPEEILSGTREEIMNAYPDSQTSTNPQSVKKQQAGADVTSSKVQTPPSKLKDTSNIEDLLMFGALSKEVVILGMKFKVRTLTVQEKEIAFASVADYAPSSWIHFSRLRDSLMSIAIDKVNNMPLETFYKPKDPNESGLSVSERRLRVILGMHGPIIDKLYELYNILEDKAAAQLKDVNFDDLKNL